MRIVNGNGTYQSSAVEFITTDDPYADLDVVGGRLRFDFNLSARGGVIEEFAIYDPDNVLLGQVEVFIFNRAPTPVADNAAFALSDAELEYLVAHIPESEFTAVEADSKGFIFARPMLQFTTTGSRLWAYIRNLEGASPLEFTDEQTVTARMTIST